MWKCRNTFTQYIENRLKLKCLKFKGHISWTFEDPNKKIWDTFFFGPPHIITTHIKLNDIKFIFSVYNRQSIENVEPFGNRKSKDFTYRDQFLNIMDQKSNCLIFVNNWFFSIQFAKDLVKSHIKSRFQYSILEMCDTQRKIL